MASSTQNEQILSPENTKAMALHDISHVFANGLTALSNVHLVLEKGERVSILGPSGCGKSTLLRLIAGLESIQKGSIHLSSDCADGLGFVFQEATLLPWASVFQNIAKPMILQNMPKKEIQDCVEDILKRVDLLEFKSAYPHQLSGGMKMRVSIARALVMRPALLLMDEPFAALDEMTRFRLNDFLLEQQELDRFTLLFVTHSIYESVYLSERVAIMSARPGHMMAQIDTTDTAHKTRGQAYRTCTSYIELCRRVSHAFDDQQSNPL